MQTKLIPAFCSTKRSLQLWVNLSVIYLSDRFCFTISS